MLPSICSSCSCPSGPPLLGKTLLGLNFRGLTLIAILVQHAHSYDSQETSRLVLYCVPGGLHASRCEPAVFHLFHLNRAVLTFAFKDIAGVLFPPLKSATHKLLLLIAMLLSMISYVLQYMGIFAVRQGKIEEIKARRRRRKNKNGNGKPSH